MKSIIKEISISYESGIKNRVRISSSEKAYEAFLSSWDMGLIELQEEFKVLLLNRSNIVLGICSLSKGGVSGTVVDAKLLYSVALKCSACSIIVAHNHPSGNLKASEADISLTKKLKQAASYLDIQFLDHLIIAKDGFSSLSDKGLF
ncbi:RadC family protein [Arenibacter sp. ARW7G5Y1]|uniref:JAB domain-containing protein n=1 Tax=Arenibacter sp. ARW7G5Y1 TaxID=2135619 RepID=UPI000D767760|nr:JAB domain-containing protein [Arenibacter sp. ARW7G5Y1]PXX22837.1 RadC-like JAB domain-containing protein [Arenibacter sp. ARW7G5Y1]